MPINGSGITLADMKPLKANRTRTLLRQTMQSSVTIWHVWLANPVVSLVVPMLSNVLSACLSSASIADNSTNNVFQTTRLM